MGEILKINTDIANVTDSVSMQDGKVLIVVLDGISKTMQLVEAVRHGETAIQTVKGSFLGVAFRGEERVKK